MKRYIVTLTVDSETFVFADIDFKTAKTNVKEILTKRNLKKELMFVRNNQMFFRTDRTTCKLD